MARLPLVDRDELPADLAQLLEGRPPLNLYRVLPWSVPTARGFLTLGRAILNQSSLDKQLRELAILRVGALTGARYEVHQHRRVAASVGLGPDKIAAALQERDEQCLDVFQRDLLRFVDAVVWQVKAPRHLYDAVAPKLGASGICELLHTIGFYMHVARFLENLEVEIEPTDVLKGALQ
jgi:4-carboxymuconolactone decarboxylase